MRKSKIWLLLFILPFVLWVAATPVVADTGNLSLRSSGKTLEKNNSFDLLVKLKTDVDSINGYFGPIYIKYEPALFSFTGGSLLVANKGNFSAEPAGSQIAITYYGTGDDQIKIPSGSADIFKLTFQAKAVGTGGFEISDAGGFSYGEGEGERISLSYAGTVQVSVTEPVVLSSDKTLKSLEVSPGNLYPAFGPSTQNYTLTLSETVQKVNVSAVPAHDKAKVVSVKGNTDLKPGKNEIKIVVRAENGSEATYTIVAQKPVPSPTPEPTPEPSPTPEPTPIPTPPVTVTLPDGTYQVVPAPENIAAPEGFYLSYAELDGVMVPVYKSMRSEFILYYLTRQSGSDGFYYRDEESGEFFEYLTISIPAQTLVVLTPDKDIVIPVDWVSALLLIDGNKLPGWKSASLPESTVILYLMDGLGEKNFYGYDSQNQLLFFYSTAKAEPTPEPTEEPTEPSEQIEETEPTSKPSLWPLATAVMGLICLALVGVLIWQGTRQRKGKDEDPEDLLPPPPIKRI